MRRSTNRLVAMLFESIVAATEGPYYTRQVYAIEGYTGTWRRVPADSEQARGPSAKVCHFDGTVIVLVPWRELNHELGEARFKMVFPGETLTVVDDPVRPNRRPPGTPTTAEVDEAVVAIRQHKAAVGATTVVSPRDIAAELVNGDRPSGLDGGGGQVNGTFEPLTDEEAQKAYDEAEPVPVSEERVKEIVEYATGHEGPQDDAGDARDAEGDPEAADEPGRGLGDSGALREAEEEMDAEEAVLGRTEWAPAGLDDAVNEATTVPRPVGNVAEVENAMAEDPVSPEHQATDADLAAALGVEMEEGRSTPAAEPGRLFPEPPGARRRRKKRDT